MSATSSTPITELAQVAMRHFADRAARAGMLPLSAAAVDAAVTTLRSELKALLQDDEVLAAVEAGDGVVGSLAFSAMVGAALVSAQEGGVR